jgi:integrase
MAAKGDARKLERTSTAGIYRRHAEGCKGNGRCRCPYVVRWKAQGQSHKQMFSTFELAREFKGGVASGKTSRRPLSSDTVASYYEGWIVGYRGRTARGLEESTRREYTISFRLHILPLSIARLRMRDLAAPDVRDWLAQLERRGASPTTIRKAKAALGVMLASAVQDGDLGSNPAASVRYVPTEQAKRQHPTRRRRPLTAADVVAILNAMPEEWRAFFTMLAQTGVRVGELLGLTWAHVHLGDDPHIMVAEQVYRGERKKLKTDASMARVPLSSTMASWLVELRPEKAAPGSPVFPSATGTPLNYHNVYSRVLRPALQRAGIAVQTGTVTVRKRGRDVEEPVWDYQGVAFHAFRKACGSLLLAHGKSLKQVQGWLRHSQLTTTMNVYIHQVDDGLGGADAWDDILGPPAGGPGGPRVAAGGPEGGPESDSEPSLAPVGDQDTPETLGFS